MLGRLLSRSPGLVFERPLMASLLGAVAASEAADEAELEPAVPIAIPRLHQACLS